MAGLTIEQQLVKVKEREAALNLRLAQKEALKLKKAALEINRQKKQGEADKVRRVRLAGEFVLAQLDDGKVRSWLVAGLDSRLTEPEDRRLFPELSKVVE